MSATEADVRALANAYREAMAEGDQALAQTPVERKILQAVVADSAASTLNWLHTRTQDGNEIGKPLEALVPALQHGNIVGTTLQTAQKTLVSQATSAVTSVVFTGTAPVWVGAILAFFAGWFGLAQNVGEDVGAALIPGLVVGGGSGAYALVRVVQSSGPMIQMSGQVSGSLWDAAGRIGAQAETLFRGTVSQRLTAVTGSAPESGVLLKMRGTAKTIVATAFGALAIGVLFFLGGVVNAWEAYQNECPVRLTDGSCLNIDSGNLGP
jgi:hypothetical protein